MRLAGQKLTLRKEHMLLMRLPALYWRVSYESITHDALQHIVRTYIEDMHGHLDDGIGFLFYGDNGVGKTGAACVLAKAVRRTGASVLFVTAESLRQGVLNDEEFSGLQSLDERAHSVDFLIIDDLGKEHRGKSGWNETYWENLFRVRIAANRSTVVTSNRTLQQLRERYNKSMLEVMKEKILPVKVEGDDRREESASELAKKFAIG